MIDTYRRMIEAALKSLKEKKIDLYTFALYHDHESGAVSVCADTRSRSAETVRKANEFNMHYFRKAVAEKDVDTAELFQFDTGRSFALGDFTCVNLARTDLKAGAEADGRFYLDMVAAVDEYEGKIRALSSSPDDVVFCCSTANDEVGLVWR